MNAADFAELSESVVSMKRLLILLLLGVIACASAQAADNSLALYAPRPDKLPEAARLRLAGSGVFIMGVDMATGKVKSVQIQKSTGHALLDRSAIQAFQKWRIRPGTVRRIVAPITFSAAQNVGRY
jgi:TonB family protein